MNRIVCTSKYMSSAMSKLHYPRVIRNLRMSTATNLKEIPSSQNVKSEVSDQTETTTPEYVKVNEYLTPSIKSTFVKEKVATFDDIPGPISLRIISKFWGLFPIMETGLILKTVQYLLSGGKFFGGLLSWGGNAPFFKKFFRVYGPVVRLHGAFGSDVVLLSRPEHANAIFQNEGPYPIRSCLGCIEKYRIESEKYRQVGPFSMYGPEWEKLRQSVEIPLQTTVLNNYEKIDDISEEFIQRILLIRNKQEEMPNYFRLELLKWSLECLCAATLNEKLGFLDPHGVSPNSDPGKLLAGLNGATEAISKCEYGFQLWKFFDTPAYKSLMKNCDMIDEVLGKHVEIAVRNLKDKKKSLDNATFLENLVLKDNIHIEDIMTLLLDMFLIGANAVAHTVAFLFYHFARNPRCQIKLHDEIKKFNGKVTRDEIKTISYLHASIKEVLRLNPPVPILTRVLNKDVVVHQYPLPTGTYVLFANHLNSISEEYFEDALKFKPERWLTNELGGFGNDYQAFASMPFGYGAKSCIAREMAEMEIAIILFKVCSKFKIEYNYGDIASSNEMIASPKKPLKFRFINRT